MTAVPSDLSLATIADGSSIIASDHRNNYAAIQTAVNALLDFLAGGSSGQVLESGGASVITWATGAGGVATRKTTAKTVNTTTAATDLLNGEFTISAGALGTNGIARLTAEGDYKQNSGGATNALRFQLALGGVVILDTGAGAGSDLSDSAVRGSWHFEATIRNLGAANSQWVRLAMRLGGSNLFGNGAVYTTGEGWHFGNTHAGGGGGIAFSHGAVAAASDTSTSKLLELKVINPSASANCETKLFGAQLEIL